MIIRIIEIVLAILWVFGTFLSPFSKSEGMLAAGIVYLIVFLLPILIIEIVKYAKKNKKVTNEITVPLVKAINKPKKQIQLSQMFLIISLLFFLVGIILIATSSTNLSEGLPATVFFGITTFIFFVYRYNKKTEKIINEMNENGITLSIKQTNKIRSSRHLMLFCGICFLLFGFLFVAFNWNKLPTSITQGTKIPEMNIETSKDNTTAIITEFDKFQENNVIFEVDESHSFSISFEPTNINIDQIKFEMSDDGIANIANVEIDKNDEKSVLSFDVMPIKTGRLNIIVNGADGRSSSEKLSLTIVGNGMTRTVYVSYYGDKYHYSKSCAGSSPQSTTLYEASMYKKPCSKCAH